MKILKKKIIIILVLIRINYIFDVSEIIVTFNTNMQRWGVILMQLNENREKYLVKYESGI